MLKTSFSSFLSTPLNEISHSLVDKWRTQKQEAGRKPTTINRQANALRVALSRAIEWDIIQDHPLKKLKNLKMDNSPKVRYFTDDERERLFVVLTTRDQKIKAARERGNEHRAKRDYDLMPSLMNHTYGDRITPLVILSI